MLKHVIGLGEIGQGARMAKAVKLKLYCVICTKRILVNMDAIGVDV